MTNREAAFTDLIVDVIRLPDGSVEVLDEDEVEEIAAEHSLPNEHIETPLAACVDCSNAARRYRAS